MKSRKQSAASAVIEASLQIAQEHAWILEANNTKQPQTPSQQNTEGTAPAVTL